MIKINGDWIDAESILLQDYLNEHGYTSGRIAVECNEEIVPKMEYATFVLRSGDTVEIVSLVGGG